MAQLQHVQQLIATFPEIDVAQAAAANINAALAAQHAADREYDLNPLVDKVHLARDKAQRRLEKSQKKLGDLRIQAAKAVGQCRVANVAVETAQHAMMGGATWQSNAPFEDAEPRMDLPELEPADAASPETKEREEKVPGDELAGPAGPTGPDVAAAASSPETKQREEKVPDELAGPAGPVEPAEPMDADRGESAEQRDQQIRDADDAEDEEVSDLARQTSQLMLAFRVSIMNAQKLLLDARTFNVGMQTILTPTGSRCILRAWTFLQNSAPKVFGPRVRSLAQMIFCSDDRLLVAFADLCANLYADKDTQRPTRNAKDDNYFNRMASEHKSIADHILDSTRLNPAIAGPNVLKTHGVYAWIFNTPVYRRSL
jgi:hypothetical protein